MNNTLHAAIEQAIASVRAKENRYTCNALAFATLGEGNTLVDKYRAFTCTPNKPYWWNDGREWHTEARIAALRAFANSL